MAAVTVRVVVRNDTAFVEVADIVGSPLEMILCVDAEKMIAHLKSRYQFALDQENEVRKALEAHRDLGPLWLNSR